MTDAPDELPAEPVIALQPAGFWIRAAAQLIDWVVLGIVMFCVGILLVIAAAILEQATGRPAAGFLQSMEKTTWIGWIGSSLATLAYHALFEGISGSTAGKRLMGLQVIAMDVTPIRLGQAVKRTVAILVDGLFFGAIAAGQMHDSPEKQRIGDQWAATRVVYRRSLPEALVPPGLKFLAALVAAVEVAAVITAVTQLLEYAAAS